MTNREIVDQFIDTLLSNPEQTMTCVRVRLSCSDYELRLLKSDPLKAVREEGDKARLRDQHMYMFPLETGQKSYDRHCY